MHWDEEHGMQDLTYTVVLEPADEGGYTVTVPALPAVVTEGDTYEEAVEMAREAIGLYLRILTDAGQESPTGAATVQISVAAPASS